MWKEKKKAITFSFDDGVMQDIKLVKLLNKYIIGAGCSLSKKGCRLM